MQRAMWRGTLARGGVRIVFAGGAAVPVTAAHVLRAAFDGPTEGVDGCADTAGGGVNSDAARQLVASSQRLGAVIVVRSILCSLAAATAASVLQVRVTNVASRTKLHVHLHA